MTPKDASAYAKEICGLAPVIPVIVVDDLAHAAPLAEALVAGGLPVLEVTLRTPVALDAIRAMSAVPGGVVGAGTLLNPRDVKAAKAAGAKFGVSPVQYGIVLLIAMGIGCFAPIIGVGMYISCSVTGTKVEPASRAMVPYAIILFIGLLIVAFVPWFSLVLPRIFGFI